jgi:hypothetical protein
LGAFEFSLFFQIIFQYQKVGFWAFLDRITPYIFLKQRISYQLDKGFRLVYELLYVDDKKKFSFFHHNQKNLNFQNIPKKIKIFESSFPSKIVLLYKILAIEIKLY